MRIHLSVFKSFIHSLFSLPLWALLYKQSEVGDAFFTFFLVSISILFSSSLGQGYIALHCVYIFFFIFSWAERKAPVN